MTQQKAPITSTLGETERDITCKALQSTLLDLVDLHLTAKQAHWTVVGRFFRSVHRQLDELVATARQYADSVAERTATLGVPPDARAATVAEGSGLPGYSAGWGNDRDVIRYVADALDRVIRRLRVRIDETDKTDLVTQDLFLEIAAKLEEAHWMWQSQLAD